MISMILKARTCHQRYQNDNFTNSQLISPVEWNLSRRTRFADLHECFAFSLFPEIYIDMDCLCRDKKDYGNAKQKYQICLDEAREVSYSACLARR